MRVNSALAELKAEPARTVSASRAAHASRPEHAWPATEECLEYLIGVHVAARESRVHIVEIVSVVVSRLLLRVGQDAVRFAEFLEFFLLLLLLLVRGARMPVRVVNERSFLVRLFDFVIIRVAIHAKNLVIIFPLRSFQRHFGFMQQSLVVFISLQFVDFLVVSNGVFVLS